MIIGTDIRNNNIAWLDDDARARHVEIIGATGSGKSVLIENLVRQMIQNNEGLCFIDPHGDTARSVIGHIPEHRKNQLIYLDLSDISHTIGLNFLTDISSDERPLHAQNIVSAFKHVYGDTSWGPRMEYIFLMSVRTLMDANLTLLALPKLFNDPLFRNRAIDKLTDPYIKHTFWTEQYPIWHKKIGPDLTSPIENKIGAVLGSPHLRAVLSQRTNTISLREIMDNQGIFIIALQKGQIGEQAAALFGALVVSMIGQTALSRADIPEKRRVPFPLIADEFQNFATAGFPLILSEARKYKLQLTLAHQGLSQLDSAITDAVFANCGTSISFRVGAKDAEVLVKQLDLGNERALRDLENYHAWYRTLENGAPASTIKIKTFPPAAPLHNKTKELIAYSQRRFGRHYEGISRNIDRFLSPNHSNTTPMPRPRRKRKKQSNGS
jgi:type IV secretory pathway TraG/TraD family ATPase VirD4